MMDDGAEGCREAGRGFPGDGNAKHLREARRESRSFIPQFARVVKLADTYV